MKVADNIFRSKSERKNFYKLSRVWSGNYHVYQNIPFLNVINVTQNEVKNANLFSFLKKTSVDYVLCSPDDVPLIAVEFDGIQQGVSVGNEYLPKKGFDISRKRSLGAKLAIANRCEFPFFVVGDSEFEEISEQVKLTIVDGIIGSVLAEKAFKREFQGQDFFEYIGYSEEEFARFSGEEQQTLVDKFGIHIEVTTELENNPITRKATELHFSLRNEFKVHGFGGVPVPDPKRYVGIEFYVEAERFGHIERHVILPRFKGPGLSGVLTLARDIAELLVMLDLQEKVWQLEKSGG